MSTDISMATTWKANIGFPRLYKIIIIFMPPFEGEEVYCFANVGQSVCRSVGRPNGFR